MSFYVALNSSINAIYPTPAYLMMIFALGNVILNGIQLADFAVGCIGYTLKHNRKHYFDMIKGRIRSVRGKIKGCGLIVFPSNSTATDFLCS